MAQSGRTIRIPIAAVVLATAALAVALTVTVLALTGGGDDRGAAADGRSETSRAMPERQPVQQPISLLVPMPQGHRAPFVRTWLVPGASAVRLDGGMTSSDVETGSVALTARSTTDTGARAGYNIVRVTTIGVPGMPRLRTFEDEMYRKVGILPTAEVAIPDTGSVELPSGAVVGWARVDSSRRGTDFELVLTVQKPDGSRWLIDSVRAANPGFERSFVSPLTRLETIELARALASGYPKLPTQLRERIVGGSSARPTPPPAPR